MAKHEKTIKLIETARAILAAYDLDGPGKAGLAHLISKSAQIFPVRVPALHPGDKDITDYYKAGGNLWEWFKYNLDRLGLLKEPAGAVYFRQNQRFILILDRSTGF